MKSITGVGVVTTSTSYDAADRPALCRALRAPTRLRRVAQGLRVLQTLPDGTKIAYVGGIEVTLTGTQRITKTYYSA